MSESALAKYVCVHIYATLWYEYHTILLLFTYFILTFIPFKLSYNFFIVWYFYSTRSNCSYPNLHLAWQPRASVYKSVWMGEHDKCCKALWVVCKLEAHLLFQTPAHTLTPKCSFFSQMHAHIHGTGFKSHSVLHIVHMEIKTNRYTVQWGQQCRTIIGEINLE